VKIVIYNSTLILVFYATAQKHTPILQRPLSYWLLKNCVSYKQHLRLIFCFTVKFLFFFFINVIFTITSFLWLIFFLPWKSTIKKRVMPNGLVYVHFVFFFV